MKTQRSHSFTHVQTGKRHLVHSPANGKKYELTFSRNGLQVKGEGLDHEITVEQDRVEISGPNNTVTTARLPLPEGLRSSERTALGVASALTGLPINILSGEDTPAIYLNLGHRPELGYRKNGTLKGGRFRVQAIERTLDDAYVMTAAKGTEFKTYHPWSQSEKGAGAFKFKKSAPGPVRFSYNEPATMEMATKSGMRISFSEGIQRLSGNTFAEQEIGTISSIWREQGSTGDPAEALVVSQYTFENLYHYDAKNERYQKTQDGVEIRKVLVATSPNEAWPRLEYAAKRELETPELLRVLKDGVEAFEAQGI